MLQLLGRQLVAAKLSSAALALSSTLGLLRCLSALAAQPALRRGGFMQQPPLLEDSVLAGWVQVRLV